MNATETEEILRRYRKRRIVGAAEANVSLDRNSIERILPHRAPILLVDSIDLLDLEGMRIRGRHTVAVDDPVFRGHFPGVPIYPGTSVVEMIGQLALCLYYFIRNRTTLIAPDASPAPVRATKILGAHFLAPVLPGAEVILEAIGIEDDGFFACAAGQAVVNGEVACVSIGEVCFVE